MPDVTHHWPVVPPLLFPELNYNPHDITKSMLILLIQMCKSFFGLFFNFHVWPILENEKA